MNPFTLITRTTSTTQTERETVVTFDDGKKEREKSGQVKLHQVDLWTNKRTHKPHTVFPYY